MSAQQYAAAYDVGETRRPPSLRVRKYREGDARSKGEYATNSPKGVTAPEIIRYARAPTALRADSSTQCDRLVELGQTCPGKAVARPPLASSSRDVAISAWMANVRVR